MQGCMLCSRSACKRLDTMEGLGFNDGGGRQRPPRASLFSHKSTLALRPKMSMNFGKLEDRLTSVCWCQESHHLHHLMICVASVAPSARAATGADNLRPALHFRRVGDTALRSIAMTLAAIIMVLVPFSSLISLSSSLPAGRPCTRATSRASSSRLFDTAHPC